MSDETEWKTIRVPKDVYQDAKARKEEHNVTWGEYVNPHAWHSVFQEPQETPDNPELVKSDAPDTDEIMRKLEQIESAQANTVGESLEIADGSLSELRQEVRKLQELVETVPEKTADELGSKYV